MVADAISIFLLVLDKLDERDEHSPVLHDYSFGQQCNPKSGTKATDLDGQSILLPQPFSDAR